MLAQPEVEAVDTPAFARQTRIGLITDSIEAERGGLATYAKSLVQALEETHPELFVCLAHERDHPFYRGRTTVRIGSAPNVGDGLWRIARKQLMAPTVLSRQALDLVHDTYHYAPFLLPTAYRRVVTIHDMIPVALPWSTTRRQQWEHRLLIPLIAQRAHHIIVDSESTKRDVVRFTGKRSEHVSVTYLAANPRFRPVDAAIRTVTLRRYGIPGRFLLHIGTVERRKNLDRVLTAFLDALPRLDGMSLVLAGKVHPSHWRLLEQRLGLLGLRQSDESEPGHYGPVIVTDRIADEDLPALYSAATALVYPSLYEGFGLPVLESMQCGTPVVTSNTSSLPEVAGDAAVLVDPLSADEIARAMVDVSTKAGLRQKLQTKGLQRAKQFSWRKCAEETVNVYHHVLAR